MRYLSADTQRKYERKILKYVAEAVLNLVADYYQQRMIETDFEDIIAKGYYSVALRNIAKYCILLGIRQGPDPRNKDELESHLNKMVSDMEEMARVEINRIKEESSGISRIFNKLDQIEKRLAEVEKYVNSPKP